jgi:hypothetical protein
MHRRHAAFCGLILLIGCRGPAPGTPAVDVTPLLSVVPPRVAAGAPLALVYSWKIGALEHPLPDDLQAFVHFLDPEGVQLFADDHVPTPNPSSWQSGRTYSYRRFAMTPVVPFVGAVRVQVGLFRAAANGERIPLRGVAKGRREYRVAEIEMLPRERDLSIDCEGLYPPESSAAAPFAASRFMRRFATCAYPDPGEDVVFFLSGDIAPERFATPPTLTLSGAGNRGLTLSFAEARATLVRLRLPPAIPGRRSKGRIRLEMSASYVPKAQGAGDDPRELSLRIFGLGVFRASRLAPQLLDGAAAPAALDEPQ